MVKRFITILFLSCIAISVFAQNNVIKYTASRKLNEANFEKNITGFSLSADVVSHTFYNGYGIITLDCDIKTLNVFAFDECSQLDAIILPNSITSIASLAFSGCANLTSINIPENIIEIGDFAFSDCRSLPVYNYLRYADTYLVEAANKRQSSYIVREGTKWIGGSAFKDCNSMTSIIIPSSVISIGEGAFSGCKNLPVENGLRYADNVLVEAVDKNITTCIIKDGTKFIASGAFTGCTSLTSVVIPESVINIGKGAFMMCSSLKSISIPNSVTRIESNAFSECSQLDSITISNSVTYIGYNAFENCRSLSKISLSKNIRFIYDSAFKGCSSLSELFIPDGVINIYNDAFNGCISLKSLSLPSSLHYIGFRVFSSCNPNMEVHVYKASLLKFKALACLSPYKVIGDRDPVVYNTKKPPLLAIKDGSLKLLEQNSNSTIDANEQCKIQFKITNKGKGPALGCEVKIKSKGSTAGLTIGSATIPSIVVNATQTIEIPVTADLNTINGTATFTIEVTEPNGYGIDPMTLTVNTRAFDAPLLKVVDYAVSGNGTIQKKQPFDLQILLQNTKYGKAENVDVSINLPTGVTIWDGQEQTRFASMTGGEQQRLNYQLAISGNYTSTSVPVQINIKEKYGRFAENKTINLSLNQQLASSTSVTLQGEQQQEQRGTITIGALGSAVDKNIPVSRVTNKNTFAFIIANENYTSVTSVPMALNDGSIFKTYCQQTLGLPAENIKYYPNATLGMMASAVSKAQEIANAYHGNVDIIFYYAGHGIPDEKTKSAYLLPVDVDGRQTSLCYSVDKLYKDLAATEANRIFVFLDACFSGSERGNGMLTSARGVAIKAQSGVPQGNMLVMCAATGDQTAYPLTSEGHGMFTYYLLEKLQKTSGDVTMLDLFNYIRDNVEQKSSVTIKTQTPTIILSPALSNEWQSWKMK